MAAQLRLFPLVKPLIERFGNDFFLNAPREPGVYFMRGAGDCILYIGQSKNLRTRLAFYKNANPDRLPRRLVRLVHQIENIAWERCPSPEAARHRELELLQLHRPRFNRADTGPQFFHFVELRREDTACHMQLHFDAPLHPSEESRIGPVRGKMIPCLALAALQRLWFSAARQTALCCELPIFPKRLQALSLAAPHPLMALLPSYFSEGSELFVAALLAAQNSAAEPALRQLQEADADLLLAWARALKTAA